MLQFNEKYFSIVNHNRNSIYVIAIIMLLRKVSNWCCWIRVSTMKWFYISLTHSNKIIYLPQIKPAASVHAPVLRIPPGQLKILDSSPVHRKKFNPSVVGVFPLQELIQWPMCICMYNILYISRLNLMFYKHFTLNPLV